MGLVTNEQEEKPKSQFLKVEDKSKIVLLSNLYKIISHFLKEKKTSVICKGNECKFCAGGHRSRVEYFYYGLLDDEEGVIRVPASVFYALNEQERVLAIDKRDSVWVISKKGSGMDTKYSAARGKEAGEPIISVDEANKRLVALCDIFSSGLKKKYEENIDKWVNEEEPPFPPEEK